MKKWKSQKGFTLIELMITCVLILFFGAILVLGVKMATDSLTNTTAYAEAQTLNGILNNAIADQIRFYGGADKLDVGTGDNVGYVVLKSDGTETLLISKKAYPNGLRVKTDDTDDLVSAPTNNIFTVKYKIIGPNNKTVATSNFQVKRHAG